MCNKCKFIEANPELPTNATRVFHDVYPNHTIKDLLIDIEAGTIGILAVEDDIDFTNIPMQDEETLADHAVLPYTYKEVPVVAGTVLLADIMNAHNQVDGLTISGLTKFMVSRASQEERYISISVKPKPPIAEFIEDFLEFLASKGKSGNDTIVH